MESNNTNCESKNIKIYDKPKYGLLELIYDKTMNIKDGLEYPNDIILPPMTRIKLYENSKSISIDYENTNNTFIKIKKEFMKSENPIKYITNIQLEKIVPIKINEETEHFTNSVRDTCYHICSLMSYKNILIGILVLVFLLLILK